MGRSSFRGSAELVLLMNSCTQHTFIDGIEGEKECEKEEGKMMMMMMMVVVVVVVVVTGI